MGGGDLEDARDLGVVGLPVARNGSPSTLVSMFRHAREDGLIEQFVQMLATASRFRPTFATTSACEVAADWVKLADGQASGSLICLPTMLAMSGPHLFVRFAKAFQGARTISALALPGFAGADRVPESIGAIVEALAVDVEARNGDAPFVLVGQSSGGWLAHALASRLECRGRTTATAVILLDSHPPGGGTSNGTLPALLGELLSDSVLDFVSDDRLTAMGAYMRLFADWRPGEIVAPTLLVKAGEPLPGMVATFEHQPRWKPVDSEIEVPGDHLTMMEEHVASTAQAVDGWLSSVLLAG